MKNLSKKSIQSRSRDEGLRKQSPVPKPRRTRVMTKAEFDKYIKRKMTIWKREWQRLLHPEDA